MSDEQVRAGLRDEDRLPWLEAVEEEEPRPGPPMLKLVAAVIIGLAALGVIVGALYWVGNRDEGGHGEIIAAPEGDYKIKPTDPGGMDVAGEGDTAFAASEGAEPKGRLNTGAAPEAPVERPQPAPAPEPTGQPPAAPTRPAPQAPVPSASGATIQLGAFGSEGGATRAWAALSGRFRYLAPLSHSVIPVQTGGRTLYRLRANGADAAGICRRLRVAGEDCEIVG
jgi:hypothetical protein